MKKLALTAAALTAFAASPLAAAGLADADTDASGTFSLEELQAAFPDLTAEAFTAMDANADGEIDQAEAQAAVEAGVLPAAG